MKLLWIDDEIDLLRPFVYALREKGYEVETTANGQDGLALAGTRDFDLILLDVMMPGMDGLEVLHRLKEADPGALVAMVTKSDSEELVNEAFGKLADDFIIKPFTPAQLLAVLKRLLEKRQLVAGRLAQEYLAAMNRQRDLSTPESWIDYYRSLSHWQELLGRHTEQGLSDVQQDRRLEANTEFCRYVESRYPGWLSGSGPVLSPRLMETVVRPHWEEKQTYFVLLDSMRADQWDAIAPLLRDAFDVETSYYYSILPTATPYSRNAIFAGMMPLEIRQRFPNYWVFEETGQNRFEEPLLAELLRRLRFRGRHLFMKFSHGDELAAAKTVLYDSNLRLAVVVLNFLDLLIHGVKSTRLLDEIVADDSALVGTTRVWFASSPVFGFLRGLARRDCRVIVTSDHGFLRVRRPTIIYGSREISANLRYKYGGALRVEERDALLLRQPERFMLPTEHPGVSYAIAKTDYYFIYPTKPREYERTYKHTFQHGGISMEEMIVPLGVLRPR
uniref:Response regulator n=1 Tax=candidate division WOR-3 bacterium TaxID=2052148 RepID=A0A7C4CC28_UNCW3